MITDGVGRGERGRITYAHVPLQGKSWLAQTQIRAWLVDATAVDAR